MHTSIAMLFLLLPLVLSGQTTGVLSGRITTVEGKPVLRATIRVLGTSPARGAISKADGSYLIAGLRAGTYDVTITAPSYREERRAGVRIKIDSTTTLNVALLIDTTRPVPATVSPRVGMPRPPGSDNNPDILSSPRTTISGAVALSARPALRGKITDSAGHPVAGATIRVVTVLGSSTPRVGYTGNDGSYLIAGLGIGRYDVDIVASGYHAVTRRGITIATDSVVTLNTVLAVDTAWRESRRSPHGAVYLPVHPVSRPVNGGYDRRRAPEGRGSEDVAVRHTLPSPPTFPYYDQTAYVICSGRSQPSGGLERRYTDYPAEARNFLPWHPEQAVMRVPARTRSASAADAALIAEAPLILYRPVISWPRDIVRMEDASGRSIDDPFIGGFGIHVISCIEVPDWFYDPAKRDVVEPSLKDQAEWLRRYEERRDMLSPTERQIARWTRRR